jgi:hypothetical protein
LQQSTTARGFAPVSTSQVDEGCFLGNYTLGVNWINGVNTGTKQLTNISSGQGGKYVNKILPDWVGSVLTSSSGVVLTITTVNNTNTFNYAITNNPTGLSDADAVQQGFEYPNTFKLDFSGSTLPLADTKQLRLDVGDGSSWVDFPTNDFQREIEFTVNTSNDSFNLLSVRFIDVDNFEGVVAETVNGDLKVIGFSVVSSIQENFVVIIPGYNAGGIVTAGVFRRSSGIGELIVEYNGLTLTDSNTFNSPTAQSISCIYGLAILPDPYDFTLISEKVIAL